MLELWQIITITLAVPASVTAVGVIIVKILKNLCPIHYKNLKKNITCLDKKQNGDKDNVDGRGKDKNVDSNNSVENTQFGEVNTQVTGNVEVTDNVAIKNTQIIERNTITNIYYASSKNSDTAEAPEETDPLISPTISDGNCQVGDIVDGKQIDKEIKIEPNEDSKPLQETVVEIHKEEDNCQLGDTGGRQDGNEEIKITPNEDSKSFQETVVEIHKQEINIEPMEDSKPLQENPVKIHRQSKASVCSVLKNSNEVPLVNVGIALSKIGDELGEINIEPMEDSKPLQETLVEIHRQKVPLVNTGIALSKIDDELDAQAAQSILVLAESVPGFSKETHILATDYIDYRKSCELFEGTVHPAADYNANALRKLADEMMQDENFEKVDLGQEDDAITEYESIIKSMLADGNKNWGRVIMAFVLGGQLWKYKGKEQVIETITRVIIVNFYVWIQDNGGWDSLQDLASGSNFQESWRPLFRWLTFWR